MKGYTYMDRIRRQERLRYAVALFVAALVSGTGAAYAIAVLS